jgi:arylsulfatase A-like enzyme
MSNGITRRDLLLSTAAAAVAARSGVAAAAQSKPNILFILADDLGYADLSIYGRRDYQTPVLDRLAREGLMMTAGYSNSAVCSATRFGLITGRYQYRIESGLREPGGGGGDDYGLPEGHPTLPSLMQKQGYRTSLFGKWHLGSAAKFVPRRHGYDYFFGFLGAASDYYRIPGKEFTGPGLRAGGPPNLRAGGGGEIPGGPGGAPGNGPPGGGFPGGAPGGIPGGARGGIPGGARGGARGGAGGMGAEMGLYENEMPVQREGYLTDLLAEHAIKEIADSVAAKKQFFMSLHFNAPHSPWEGPKDEQAIKDGTFNAGGSLAKYAEMVIALDSAVGRVLQQLKKSGIERDTLVVFTSDNGGERFSDDWPFIGMKGELLEGGIRVPLMVRWPGRIKSGRKSDQVMITMDFLPTLLAVAGGAPDSSYPTDGMNLLPVILGQQEPVPRKLFWRYKANDQHVARDGDWKYIKIGDQEHLFNVVQDQHERADLRTVYPERFNQLKADFQTWNTNMLTYPEGMVSWNAKGELADRY